MATVYFSQKNGFASQQALWAAIMKELSSNGMNVVSVDGVPDGVIGDTITGCVLEATTTIDPLATEQPWRLCCKVDANSVRLYAAPPTQISDTGNVAKVAHLSHFTGAFTAQSKHSQNLTESRA